MTTTHSGGCQCGAIRFRVEGALGTASVCHCRMCQKAFGAFYAPLVNLGDAKITWTRGELQKFQSSEKVMRGFCQACGTPLTYEAPGEICIAIGAFDEPEKIVPVIQYGVQSKLPYADGIPTLPTRPTIDGEEPAFVRQMISYQHPDHDTDRWPPKDQTR